MKFILSQLGKKTLIMGILNITPNSFSDGNLYLNPKAAIERAKIIEEEGADIVDLGGESTHPRATPISTEEELKRVIPIIEELSKFISIPISIDTRKAQVAEAALNAGASIVNDTSGLQDSQMATVIAKHDCSVIIMHSKFHRSSSDNVMNSIIEELKQSIHQAVSQGIKKEQIILDPGFGFEKSFEENLELMKNLEKLTQLNYPILLGTSRKGTLGKILNLDAKQRLEATLATTAIAIMQGISIIRVHDVKENVRTAKVADAIYKSC